MRQRNPDPDRAVFLFGYACTLIGSALFVLVTLSAIEAAWTRPENQAVERPQQLQVTPEMQKTLDHMAESMRKWNR